MASSCRADHAGSRCRLAEPRPVAKTQALRFDAIALTATTRGLLAAWSSTDGTLCRWLDHTGSPTSPATTVDAACPGGVALASRANTYYLACSRPEAASDTGELVLYVLDRRLRVRAQRKLAEVGRDSRGVALALVGHNLQIVFHSGRLGDHAVYRAVIAPAVAAETASGTVRQDRLSSAAHVAADPALLVRGQDAYVTWSETVVGFGPTLTRLMLARDAQPARVLGETNTIMAAPRLVDQGGGQLLLGYRRLSPRTGRETLVLARLQDDLPGPERPTAVGRANGEGSPELLACGGLDVGVFPIVHGSERYVALHALDQQLRPIEENHQFYVSGHEYSQVAAACTGKTVVTLAAERKAPPNGGAELLAMEFACR